MKKILCFAVLLASMLAAGVASAQDAVVRVEREIYWANSYPNHIWDGTIVSKPLAGATADTTSPFTLSDAAIRGAGFPISSFNVESKNDSLLVGFVHIYRDSVVAGSPTLTAVTAKIETSYDGRSWANCGVVTGSANSGDCVIAIPIYLLVGDTNRFSIFSPLVRLAFTTTTGIMPSARIKLVYWADANRR